MTKGLKISLKQFVYKCFTCDFKWRVFKDYDSKLPTRLICPMCGDKNGLKANESIA